MRHQQGGLRVASDFRMRSVNRLTCCAPEAGPSLGYRSRLGARERYEEIARCSADAERLAVEIGIDSANMGPLAPVGDKLRAVDQDVHTSGHAKKTTCPLHSPFCQRVRRSCTNERTVGPMSVRERAIARLA
jgi:hypothetical protein